MDGPHDLGGAHGLGRIAQELDEPVFHADWEKTALALNIAAGALGRWNIDMGRHARERQHPVNYLSNSYYQNWLAGLAALLVEQGLVTAEELASGKADGLAPAALRKKALTRENTAKVLTAGRSAERDISSPPAYRVGDAVKVRVAHPQGHTRAPRYVRGRQGVITTHYGAHVFPDLNAHGEEAASHLYNVRFDGVTLWGSDAEAPCAVYVDLWQGYLVAADE